MSNLSQTDYNAIVAAARNYNVPVGLMLAVQQQESGGATNPDTLTNKDSSAVGMFQILSGTASKPGYGVTPIDPSQRTDPVASSNFAAQYLHGLYAANGDSWDAAVGAYSGGNYNYATLQQKYPGVINVSDTTSAAGAGGSYSDDWATPHPGQAPTTAAGAGGSYSEDWANPHPGQAPTTEMYDTPYQTAKKAAQAVTAAASGWAALVGELALRAGIGGIGVGLLFIALIYMMWKSGVVNVPASALAELA